MKQIAVDRGDVVIVGSGMRFSRETWIFELRFNGQGTSYYDVSLCLMAYFIGFKRRREGGRYKMHSLWQIRPYYRYDFSSRSDVKELPADKVPLPDDVVDEAMFRARRMIEPPVHPSETAKKHERSERARKTKRVR